MLKITQNTERIGRVTSSEIFKLFGSATVRKNYLEEKKLEIQLGRSLDVDAKSDAIIWGELVEKWVGNTKGTDYIEHGHKSIAHHILAWAGSPDGTTPRKEMVSEIKGYQPKNFATYTNALLAAKNDTNTNIFIRNTELREKFAKEYWQGISNSILTKLKYVELICAMPKFSDLPAIFEIANNWYEEEDQWRYKNIADAIFNEQYHKIAFLPDESTYDAINSYVFECPEEDIKALVNEVTKATAELNMFRQGIKKVA